MSRSFQPILGAKCTDLRDIRLPCIAFIKLDGWRAVWQHLEFFTRKLNAVPNREVQQLFSKLDIPTGYDGELIYGEPNASDCFRRTDKILKSAGAPGDGIRFFVFDNAALPYPYYRRYESLQEMLPNVIRLDGHLIETYDQLVEFEKNAVELRYEGIVTRNPEGVYKLGRSTMNEQYLVKVKRFSHIEAKVVGFEELFRNANPATLDGRGYTQRSTHAEGKIPAGVLGALIVHWRGQELRVGTGFTSKERREIWLHRSNFLGHLARIKHLNTGAKPVDEGGTGIRPPLVFTGFRHDL